MASADWCTRRSLSISLWPGIDNLRSTGVSDSRSNAAKVSQSSKFRDVGHSGGGLCAIIVNERKMLTFLFFQLVMVAVHVNVQIYSFKHGNEALLCILFS